MIRARLSVGSVNAENAGNVVPTSVAATKSVKMRLNLNIIVELDTIK